MLGEYTALFTATTDEYLRERLADVRDVMIRLSGHLSDVLKTVPNCMQGPLILVAEELLPSQVVTLGQREVQGIVTQAGGRTSHAAILARSRGIPAVSGVRGILKQVRNGDTLVVDGREGHVLDQPRRRDGRARIGNCSASSSISKTRWPKIAISRPSAPTASTCNCWPISTICPTPRRPRRWAPAGVGLFRTEYLFLTHPNVPDEEEQMAAYREIIAASPGRCVTIRTLDLGGDKTIPYLGHAREANPFMGWRSIRLSFEHPEFFTDADPRHPPRGRRPSRPARKRVRMMFPMITTLEEMRRVRTMVRARAAATEGRRQTVRPGAASGLMLEVPAAAISIDQSAAIVDFVSIGSNDLVQYLMAADRDNPKVSHLCQPLSPAGAARARRRDPHLPPSPQAGDACAAKWPALRGPSCCCLAWACAASA